MKRKMLVDIIELHGVLTNKCSESTFNANFISKALQKAASNNSNHVILDISSPGGDEFQAEVASNAVRAFVEDYPNINTIALCNQMCASAAYMIAAATSKIYAFESSMVGSIGTILDLGFDLSNILDKLHIAYNLITSSEDKVPFGSIFTGMTEDQEQRARELTKEAEKRFIERVKKWRPDAPFWKEEEHSAAIFSAFKAKELGLVDMVLKTSYLIYDMNTFIAALIVEEDKNGNPYPFKVRTHRPEVPKKRNILLDIIGQATTGSSALNFKLK